MNDAVDRLIVERGAMDHGFSGGLLLSVFAHLGLVGVAIAAPYMRPKTPPIRVMDGFAVPMPPGGGGTPNAQPAPAVSTAPDPAPAEPDPPPAVKPPDVIKPPSKTEPKKTGLPELNAKAKKSKKDVPDHPATSASNPPTTKTAAKSGAPGGTGTGQATPGLEFGPAGPGVPGGTDWLGDWYLAGVQRKIWSLWTQQIRSEFTRPITVRFTILPDGTVGSVDTVESSGSAMLDMAAKRAVYSAAPFGPLPKTYGTNAYTVQAVFKPTS